MSRVNFVAATRIPLLCNLHMFPFKKPALLPYFFMVVGWNFNDHRGG